MSRPRVVFLLRRRVGFVYSHTRYYNSVSRASAAAMLHCRRKPRERVAILCADHDESYINLHPYGEEGI